MKKQISDISFRIVSVVENPRDIDLVIERNLEQLLINCMFLKNKDGELVNISQKELIKKLQIAVIKLGHTI